MHVTVCIYGSDWHVASAVVSSPYRAFSADRISARVGVHIGLNSVNITLREPLSNFSGSWCSCEDPLITE
ncbi:hypothetical protein V5799_015045 [Amblyomma americanum]|uniref:Uncharacterized protein n=1 Tax=Amblyomma americanum TaxID=6943 RepID=A0AAQ4E199_AMBAM